MRINNLTPFDTERLRQIAQQVAERELEPYQRDGITVHFVPAKARTDKARQARRDAFARRWIGKLPAGLKYNQAIVSIRTNRDATIQARIVALLLAHEFAEMRGLDHKTMRTPRYFFRGNWQDFYTWADQYPLILAPKKLKPVTTDQSKLAHVERMLRLATTREKRARTIRQKWQRKAAYYQKKLAAVAIDAPHD